MTLESLAAISIQPYLPNILKSDKIAGSLHEYRFSFSPKQFAKFLWSKKITDEYDVDKTHTSLSRVVNLSASRAAFEIRKRKQHMSQNIWVMS